MATESLPTDLTPASLFTRKRPISLWGRVIQFPLVRVPVVVLFLVPPILAHNLIVIHGVERLSSPWFEVALDLLFPVDFALLILFYRLYTRWIEGRPAHEVSSPGAVGEFAGGVGVAGALIGTMFLVLMATGSYRVTGVHNPWIVVHALLFFGAGALLQVLAFRIILYRLVEEWVGTWIAMALTAGLFSLAHVGNENMTLAGYFGLLIGDVLLCAAFVLTRRLWFVWGLHTGWNFFQDGILGMPNSGITSLPSLLDTKISGPWWLTGGPTGVEASVVATILQILCGVWILRLAIRRRRIVEPSFSGVRISAVDGHNPS